MLTKKRPPISDATRKKMSESHKGIVPWHKGKTNVYSKETLDKMSKKKIGANHPLFGKHHTDEARLKISIGNKGKPKSEEHTRKNSEGHKGKVPWNKGIPHTEEAKNNMSKSHIGYVASEETRKKLSELNMGKNNPMFGRRYKMSEETKKKIWEKNIGHHVSEEGKLKMSKAKKGKPSPRKGAILSNETKQKLRDVNIGRKHTEETLAKISGENSYMWKGGISFIPYCHKFNNRLKRKIRDRDNHICQLCGKNEHDNKRKLSIHHIHYDKENCNPDLITLCKNCNTKVNNNREYYEPIFMNKLNERGLLFWCQ